MKLTEKELKKIKKFYQKKFICSFSICMCGFGYNFDKCFGNQFI